jgi:hypothetical protein
MAFLSPLVRAKSVTENLVDGAVLVANGKLFDSPEDQRGLDLLRFALALDPENRDALLIQAKIDRKQKLEDARFADGGAQYVNYVLNIAKHTRSKRRRLLLYKVVELVSPKNETAMLELTKAKNKGRDVSFNALVQVLLPEEEKEEEPKKVPTRVVVNNGPEMDGKGDILAELERLRCRADYMYMSNPLYGFNNLNQALFSSRHAVYYESKKHPIGRTSGSTLPRYYTSESLLPPVAFNNVAFYYDTTGTETPGCKTQGDWLRIFCAMYGKGWCHKGTNLAVVDADHEDVEEGSGIPMKAEDLFEANREGRLDFRAKYMGKHVFVSGFVSGVTKEYVHLANDRVRLIFDSSVPEERLSDLSDEYGKAADRKRTVLFAGTAVCETVRTGRIHLDKCKVFSWTSVSLQQTTSTGIRVIAR